MSVLGFLFTSIFAFADSVSVFPGYISVDNTVFSVEEESSEESEGPVLSFSSRQSVTDSLRYSAFSGDGFTFPTSLESYLMQKRRLGQRIYIIQSDLQASLTEDPLTDEVSGSLNYRFQLEHGDENVSYKYLGYINHFDEQSTSLGLQFSIVRSRNFRLCSLDDEAVLKVDLIQEDLQVRGIYDSKVHCMFSENIEQTNEVYFVVSSESEDIFEEVKVSSETVISLSKALSLRHRISYDDTIENNFAANSGAPGSVGGGGFESPQFFFGSGPSIGNLRLERFNEQPGYNNEVNLEYEVSSDDCSTKSSLMLAVFRPLDQDQDYNLWEVSLNRTCKAKEEVMHTFELTIGNAYFANQSPFFGPGRFDPSNFTPESSTSVEPSTPLNSAQLRYAYDSKNLDYSFSLNFAEISDTWVYDLTFDRSVEYESRDRYDLKFRFVSTEDNEFLYGGFGYYYFGYATQVEAGLTSDFDSNLYLSLGLSKQNTSRGLDYSLFAGFPMSDEDVLNQGPGLRTSERFMQFSVGSTECEPTKELCWRGTIQRDGESKSFGLGGFIEF